MNRKITLFFAGLFLAPFALSMSGCAGDQPSAVIPEGEPVGLQLLRAVPSLKDERFSTLLDFESADDAVFCDTTGPTGAIASDHAHTGRSAYKLDSQASRLTIKLDSLLAGRAFPASWALIGGYFYSEQATKITVGLSPPLNGSEPRAVDLPAGTWTPVFAELPHGASAPSVPSLNFDLPSPHAPVWCDDVMLIDNYKLLTTSPDASAGDGSVGTADVVAGIMPPWTIIRRGLNYIGSAPSRFNFTLVTSQACPTGWTVDEANPMRARFHSDASSSNPARTLTIYADGRAFGNADYKPMSSAGQNPILHAEHQTPAQIEVTEGMGRVDRNTPGDTRNSGYNPTTGSYRIIATGPRIELRFIPHGVPVLSPILEISGLPFGKPLLTLEGRLIEQSIRTASGTLLVELPAQIDRAVTVNVRIEE